MLVRRTVLLMLIFAPDPGQNICSWASARPTLVLSIVVSSQNKELVDGMLLVFGTPRSG